ncbi:MAG: Nif3-like dinuclear metal center hexameric protein [Acutalibacteraceae bacterium]
MPSVKEIYKYLDEKFPYCMQENYDNSGIMVDCGRNVTKVVVSLDITNEVVDYAASFGAELIVSHHPVIFRPIKSISCDAPVYRLIANEISAISAHTNYDIADGGVNDQLASKLNLQLVKPVFKVSECSVNGVLRENYIGRMGVISEELTPSEFAEFVANRFGKKNGIEYVDGRKKVKTVAVGGGACGEFVFECKKYGIDAFVTGEAKHHEMIYAAENGITLIAAGHYATENVALEKLASTLAEGFEDLTVEVTRLDDPLKSV